MVSRRQRKGNMRRRETRRMKGGAFSNYFSAAGRTKLAAEAAAKKVAAIEGRIADLERTKIQFQRAANKALSKNIKNIHSAEVVKIDAKLVDERKALDAARAAAGVGALAPAPLVAGLGAPASGAASPTAGAAAPVVAAPPVVAPAAAARSGFFSSLPSASSLYSSLPSLTRKSTPAPANVNPFAGKKGATSYPSYSSGNALTLSSVDPITPLTSAEKAEILRREAVGQIVPNKSTLNKYRSEVPAPLFLNRSSLSSRLQGARNYMTTLKEGTDWKRATQNSAGKNIITALDPMYEKADWSESASGRAGSKFYQNVVLDTYPDASTYGKAANFKRANGTLVDPTAFITERKEKSKIRVYGKTPDELDLVVREGSRRIVKQQLNAYTKKLTERSVTDKKKWDGIVQQKQDAKNKTMKKVSKMYGDYLTSIRDALDKQMKADNEQLEIQTAALINDEIPTFVADSVYIPKPVEIKGAKNAANATAKSDAAKAVTVETIKAGMEAAAKGAPVPAVPLNAVVAPPAAPAGLFNRFFGSKPAAPAPPAPPAPAPPAPPVGLVIRTPLSGSPPLSPHTPPDSPLNSPPPPPPAAVIFNKKNGKNLSPGETRVSSGGQITVNNEAMCESQCANNAECKAYVFDPDAKIPNPNCWLLAEPGPERNTNVGKHRKIGVKRVSGGRRRTNRRNNRSRR